jgi:hypothetical protein
MTNQRKFKFCKTGWNSYEELVVVGNGHGNKYLRFLAGDSKSPVSRIRTKGYIGEAIKGATAVQNTCRQRPSR